jgi:DNA-binding Lrp family transcriptional regulator
MDDLDRSIVNALQGGLPVSEQPYRDAAFALGIGEDTLIERLGSLLGDGTLSRFGPMFDATRMGGSVVLCAMAVPPERFDEVAETVNDFHEVAHNYARAHRFNMWFVVATETPDALEPTIDAISKATDLEVFAFPKEEEFYVGLRFTV